MAPPKGNENALGLAAESSSKGKSAKELKKEKRAAAVAARGPAATERPGSSSSAQQQLGSSPQRTGSIAMSSGGGGSGGGAVAQESSRFEILSTIDIPLASSSSSSAASSSRQPAPSSKNTKSMETAFFSHLPNHSLPDTAAAYKGSKIHPAVIQAGIMMSSGEIRGANARTMATMLAFQQVIEEYQCPEQTVLWKDLPNHLSPMIAWLEDCRPKGVGGGNAIRWLKGEINRLGEVDMGTDIEQKRHLVGAIDDYLTQKIEFADQIIISHAQEKIKAGDTIVTYARSSIIEKVLLQAWRRMKEVDSSAEFRVIVVDSRPLNEGRSTLYTLTNAGIPCTYTLLPLASSVLPNANLVLVGASALHSDGSLYSRAGTAVISMLAKEYRVPVVACVETYKFGERVSLDSVASNEIGEPEQLLQIPGGKPFQGDFPATLTPLNLMYDLTPANLITTLCTELGFIPPSSVPTVLGKTAPVV